MKELLLEAVKTLHQGGVVLHPTETCYGLAVDIFQKRAVEKLYSLKKMSHSKAVSILVRDLDEAHEYGEFSPRAIQFALAHWPGALTIIVPRKPIVPVYINPENDSIGIRVSSNKKTKQLIEAFGGPITTTSANLSGELPAYNVQEFLDQGLIPDFILDGGQIGKTLASTVIKFVGAEIKVLRHGFIQISP